MSTIENMADEQIATALARSESTIPELTVWRDQVVAHQEASRRMKKIRALLEQRAVVESSAKEQLGEITVWRDQEFSQLDGEVERLKLEMQPIVAMLTANDPRGKRSVNLVAGTAGWRAGRERVVVDDEEAALSWLTENGGDRFIRTKQAVDVAGLKADYPLGEAPIPGVRVEHGEDAFYVTPTGKSG